ncbi:MAG: MAPEG family protein [Paracoccaceae bacterium]|nr:MAPEG family protein [Paracoccaceae bacterium]
MLIWILLGLAVLVMNIYLSALLYLPAIGVSGHVGSRDELPEPGKYVMRARRAQANMLENFPVFATLGLLAMASETADMGQAILGAQLFVIGRIIYIPLYLVSVPWTRSVAYGVAFVGQVLMLLALL